MQEIVNVTIAAAKAAKPWAVQILMDRIFPVPRDRTVQFELPDIRTVDDVSVALNAVMQGVAGGLLTVAEAASVCSLISDYCKPIVELAEAQLEQFVVDAEAD
jgi:hypothetical protein